MEEKGASQEDLTEEPFISAPFMQARDKSAEKGGYYGSRGN